MSKPYAIYLCGTDPQCAPCRANEHQQCSWDGDPDCQCSACPAERKAANLAALDVELDRGERERAARVSPAARDEAGPLEEE